MATITVSKPRRPSSVTDTVGSTSSTASFRAALPIGALYLLCLIPPLALKFTPHTSRKTIQISILLLLAFYIPSIIFAYTHVHEYHRSLMLSRVTVDARIERGRPPQVTLKWLPVDRRTLGRHVDHPDVFKRGRERAKVLSNDKPLRKAMRRHNFLAQPIQGQRQEPEDENLGSFSTSSTPSTLTGTPICQAPVKAKVAPRNAIRGFKGWRHPKVTQGHMSHVPTIIPYSHFLEIPTTAEPQATSPEPCLPSPHQVRRSRSVIAQTTLPDKLSHHAGERGAISDVISFGGVRWLVYLCSTASRTSQHSRQSRPPPSPASTPSDYSLPSSSLSQ